MQPASCYSQLTRHPDGSATLAVYLSPADMREIDAIADDTPRSPHGGCRAVHFRHGALFGQGSAPNPHYEWGYLATPIVPIECWRDQTTGTDTEQRVWRLSALFPAGGYWRRTTQPHTLDAAQLSAAPVGAQ